MAQIIITPDDSIYNANSPTFLVYGSKCKDLLYIRPKDRKSTRLNSSHLGISYAVFCLKKKNKKTNSRRPPRE